MVWSGDEKEIARWCKRNKVYDEITEKEIEEIWNRDDPDDEPIRLNGKYVWETTKRVCDYINAHEELIQITMFREYRVVMKKIMRVIKEAHNVERKRRHPPARRKVTTPRRELREPNPSSVTLSEEELERKTTKDGLGRYLAREAGTR